MFDPGCPIIYSVFAFSRAIYFVDFNTWALNDTIKQKEFLSRDQAGPQELPGSGYFFEGPSNLLHKQTHQGSLPSALPTEADKQSSSLTRHQSPVTCRSLQKSLPETCLGSPYPDTHRPPLNAGAEAAGPGNPASLISWLR